MPPSIRLALALLLLTASARAAEDAAPPASPAVAEIAACMRENLPEEHSIQQVRLVTAGKTGRDREVEARVLWKRFEDGLSRALIQVEAPDDLRDSKVLLIQRSGGADLFLYSPELRKVRRITTHTLNGNLFGSDFTYEDFLLLYGMSGEGTTERLPDTERQGRPVYAFAQRAAPEAGSGYDRVVAFVDRETCVLLEAEMWEPGERLRKVMTARPDAVIERDGVRVPERVLLRDLKRESQTRLDLVELDLERRVRARDLTPAALEQVRR